MKVPANGIELDYEESGAGEAAPLVLIRGLGTERTAWPRELLDDLVDRGFRVIVFDNRDAGLSTKFDRAGTPDLAEAFGRIGRGEPIEAAYRIDDMADDVVGLLDALEIERAHVAGNSMGGFIAQSLLARRGDRLLSATSIMSSTGNPELPGPTPEAAAALLSQPRSFAREDVIENSLYVQRTIGGSGFPASEDYLRERAGRAYDRCYCPAGVARQMLAILASGSRVELLGQARVPVPTLVIHGNEDPLVPLACGEDTAHCIPGAELLVVPGMGHDVVPGNAPILAEAIAKHALAATA